MTHNELQLLLLNVETAQRQLTTIQKRLQESLRGNAPEESSYADTNPTAEPSAELLAREELQCPICKAQMRWRYSRANGQWFAGCTEFKPHGGGCRGSRSYAKVLKANEKPSAAAADAFAEDKIPF